MILKLLKGLRVYSKFQALQQLPGRSGRKAGNSVNEIGDSRLL
jgi:hypothetical protein